MSTTNPPTDRHRAEGRVVLVIGGTSGIGLVTAQQLAERGSRVVVAARDQDRVDAVVASLPSGAAVGVAADVLDADAVERAVAACVERYGRLDAVIQTAQVMAYGTVEDVPPEIFERVVDTAITGTFHVARAALAQFRRQGHGSLVVVSSLLAEIAVPTMGAYVTAKWGQLGLVRSLQLEVADLPSVHVSLVAPGAIDTPIYAQAANVTGRPAAAPGPVVPPSRVARACIDALDHPRRLVHVGPINRVAVFGFRVLPAVYDRLAPRLVQLVVLRGKPIADKVGNVLAPDLSLEAPRGGWTWYGARKQD